MQPQYSQGAAPSHHPPPYAPPEVPQVNGGSITSSLRQWRKKDYVEKKTAEENSPAAVNENPSHIARVAPHTYYPRPPDEPCNYQNPYGDYSVPYKPTGPVKYSEIVENQQAQSIEHITPVIQKHKEKDYVELCGGPPQSHLKQFQDHLPMKQSTYSEPPHSHHYIPKDSQIHQFLQKQPQMHQYMQKESYPQLLSKYNMQSQYSQPYPSEPNSFLSHLNKINPRMAQSIINDTHLRDSQIPMYHNLDQNRYPQPQRMYHTSSMPSNPSHPQRNLPSSYNYPQSYNYNVKPNIPPVDPYNRPYQHNVSKYLPEQSIPNISPQRLYHEGMHMNYGPYPPKISPNYPSQLEYAQHYQHRRQLPQEFYTHPPYKDAFVQNPQISPEDLGSESGPRKSSLKQYLETWVEENISGNLPDIIAPNALADIENIQNLKTALQAKNSEMPEQPLYVLDTTEITNDNLPHFLHLQQFEKLPENIRGYYHSTNVIPPESRQIIIEKKNQENFASDNPSTKVRPNIPKPFNGNCNMVATVETGRVTDQDPKENSGNSLANKVVEIHILEGPEAAELNSEVPVISNSRENSSEPIYQCINKDDSVIKMCTRINEDDSNNSRDSSKSMPDIDGNVQDPERNNTDVTQESMRAIESASSPKLVEDNPHSETPSDNPPSVCDEDQAPAEDTFQKIDPPSTDLVQGESLHQKECTVQEETLQTKENAAGDIPTLDKLLDEITFEGKCSESISEFINQDECQNIENETKEDPEKENEEKTKNESVAIPKIEETKRKIDNDHASRRKRDKRKNLSDREKAKKKKKVVCELKQKEENCAEELVKDAEKDKSEKLTEQKCNSPKIEEEVVQMCAQIESDPSVGIEICNSPACSEKAEEPVTPCSEKAEEPIIVCSEKAEEPVIVCSEKAEEPVICIPPLSEIKDLQSSVESAELDVKNVEVPEICQSPVRVNEETVTDVPSPVPLEEDDAVASPAHSDVHETLLEDTSEEMPVLERAAFDENETNVVYHINDSNVVLQIADELLEINITVQNGKKLILVKTFSDAVIMNNAEDNNCPVLEDQTIVQPKGVSTVESPAPPPPLENYEAVTVDNIEMYVKEICEGPDITIENEVCVFNEEVVSSSTEVDSTPKPETVETPIQNPIVEKKTERKRNLKKKNVTWSDDTTAPLAEAKKCLDIQTSVKKIPKTKAALKLIEPCRKLKDHCVPSKTVRNSINHKIAKIRNSGIDPDRTKPKTEKSKKVESRSKNDPNVKERLKKKRVGTKKVPPIKDPRKPKVLKKNPTPKNNINIDSLYKMSIEPENLAKLKKEADLSKPKNEEVEEKITPTNQTLEETPPPLISVQENSITSSTCQETEALQRERASKLIQQINDDWEDDFDNTKIVDNTRRLSLQEYIERKRTGSGTETDDKKYDFENPDLTSNLLDNVSNIRRKTSPKSPELSVKFINKTYSRSAPSEKGGDSCSTDKKEESLSSSIELQLPKRTRIFPTPNYNQEYLRKALMNDLHTVNQITTTLIKENQDLMHRFLEQQRLSTSELKKVKQIIRYKRLVQHLTSMKIKETEPNLNNNNIVQRELLPSLGTEESSEVTLKKANLEKRKKKRFRFLYSDDESDSHDLLNSSSIVVNEDETKFDKSTCLKRPRVDNAVPTVDYSVHQRNSQGQLTLVFKRNVKSDPRMQPFVKLKRSPSLDSLASKLQ